MMFRIIILVLCFITMRCHANDDEPNGTKISLRLIGEAVHSAALFATILIRDIPRYIAHINDDGQSAAWEQYRHEGKTWAPDQQNSK